MLKEVNSSLYKSGEKSKLSILLNALIILIICVLAFEIYFSARYSGIYIVHSSMRPTLTGAPSLEEQGGDYVYIDKHAKPDYGDIVVVYDGQGEYIIKRAVAFGGDSVKLSKGKLYIRYKGTAEFKLVDEPYIYPEYNNPDLKKNNFEDNERGYLVQEGHFFLLGDNRNDSVDSRSAKYGSLPVKNLDGVVTRWSLEHKSFFTAMHNYFKFQLPSYFGIK